MKRFLELLGDRKDEIDEQLLEMLYSLTEFQTFKEIMLVEKKRIEHERKNLEETCKKKIPTKPLKQSSNNNTNIFSIDNKKEMFLKEENKMEINSKVLKNKIAKVNENRTDNNKKEKNECLVNKFSIFFKKSLKNILG